MTQFIQFTVGGLTTAAIYALIALGLSLIYHVSRVLNLAQGTFYTLAAFLAFTLISHHLHFLLAFVLSILITVCFGLVFERLVITPVGNATLSVLLMLTLAVSMIAEGVMKLIWGTYPVSIPPLSGNKGFEVFGISILSQNIWIVFFTVLILCALYLFFKYTYVGKAMTAVADNPLAAGIMGINAKIVRAVAFGISALIGALGGILAAPITLVSYDSSTMIGLKGFIAAVVGGISNVFSGVIGSIVLGLSEAYSAGYISSLFQDTTAFIILLIVLIGRSLRQKQTFIGHPDKRESFSLSVKLNRPGKLVMGALFAVAVLLPAFVQNGYFFDVMIIMLIYMIVVIGLDLLFGFTGILSLGQAGFMAIAAYTAAILTRDVGLPPILALLIAVLVSCALAWILAVSTTRLSGYNIAIATLGFAIIIEGVAVGWRDVTGGAAGFTGVPPFSIGPFVFDTNTSFYYLVLFITTVIFIFAYNITRSHPGRVMKSINRDPLAASSVGINVVRYKVFVFVLSAALAAVGGVFYVFHMGFISPGMVGMDVSILLLIMLVLGGEGTLWGLIPGVIIMKLIPEVFSSIANYQIIFEGVILILILMFFRGGLWELFQRAGALLHKKTGS